MLPKKSFIDELSDPNLKTVSVETVACRGHQIVAHKRFIFVSTDDELGRLGVYLLRLSLWRKTLDELLKEEHEKALDSLNP